ncbi:DUF4123 domain-containing protein [Stutzerimonas urumqiensis]|uniref:DUF4123 domain-containing protein n=1 Tax=Stutzerimonas urumqiensis TaxID=638269 RepID=UPI003BACF3B7
MSQITSDGDKAPREPGNLLAANHYAIVERSSLNEEAQHHWHSSPLPRMSLMSQPEFDSLRDEGPWLVALGEPPESGYATLRDNLGSQAVLGRLSSPLSLPDLASHLSDALICQDKQGATYLLRSYVPHVLAVLHQRKDCPWHGWLFGPIIEWSAEGTDGRIHTHAGHGLSTVPEYVPITLDASLTAMLAIDQQALALLNELKRAAPDVFQTNCHGERLMQVAQALTTARTTELEHPDDHNLFAALYLLDGQAPDKTPHWPAAIRLVKEQNQTLGQALEAVQERHHQ